ncbi:sensor histidine kinase [Sediminitomix flava]|uniref:histidine kinase n=1 Tax=Sediminitomix flava TaxID=379075 RepID=A0A316A274_SEDFL|nr:ATP-binding protein [Sediminitomix flava]PWJ43797.1 histidine kinase/DNA gyrase B/HSP90-like ATPase [Sediminitomix flava]
MHYNEPIFNEYPLYLGIFIGGVIVAMFWWLSVFLSKRFLSKQYIFLLIRDWLKISYKQAFGKHSIFWLFHSVEKSSYVLSTNEEGEITFANPLLSERLGLSFKELEGSKIEDLFSIEDHTIQNWKEYIQTKELIYLPLQSLKNPNEQFYFCVGKNSSRSTKHFYTFMSWGHQADTPYFHKKEEIEFLEEKIDKLDELNNTKNKFFSIIAHDVKGPLNTLSSFSKLLSEHSNRFSNSEITMIADDIHESTNSVYKMLEDLMSWTRSHSGEFPFRPQKNFLNRIVYDNIELLDSSFRNKKIQLSLQLSKENLVWVDKDSVKTVIRNLLSNALKFTPENGEVFIYSYAKDDQILLAIQDNGVGIAKEYQDRIFKIDQKFTTKGTRDEKGSGFGLVLCKEFMEKNKGKIWLESEYGLGTTFFLSFPRYKEVPIVEELVIQK